MKMLRLMKQAKTSLARSSRALMVLCAGSLLMLASQAQAGEWVFSCERTSGTSSGTYSVLPGDPTQMPPVSETFSFDWPSNKYTDPNNDYQTKYPWFPWLRNVSPAGAGAFGSAWANSSIGAGKVAVTGDMKVVATWTLRAGETTLGPVPPSLNVLVSASTQAAACNSYDQNNAAVAAQRDATGEDGKADVTVDGAQAAKSSSVTAGSSQWRASAARLFNLKTNGQSRVEVTTVNLSAQGNIPDGRSYYVYPNANNPNIPQSQWYTTKLKIALRGFVNASGSVGATEDPRTLTISRGISAKKWNDPTLNQDRDEWVEADGTGHGHTTYSYNYESKWVPLIKRSYYNWQTFTASASGNWSPNATGTWSPSDADDTKTQHKQSMDFGKPELSADYGWIGDETGIGKASVDYTITDSSTGTPVTAKAHYDLKLHDEWEFNRMLDNVNPSVYSSASLFQYNYPNQTDAPITAKFKITNKTSESKSGELKADAGIGVDLPAIKKLGIKFDPINVDVNADFKVSSETTTEADFEQPVSISPGKFRYIVLNRLCHYRRFVLDHWGAGGFIGESTVETSTFNDINAAPLLPLWSDEQDIPGGATGGDNK